MKGELRPREVAECYLARIEKMNPELGAYVTVTADRALADAARLEESKADASSMRLHGVAYSLKDLTPTAGIRTTLGSRNYADSFPPQDAVIAQRLQKAGGILLGKTSTPEFGGRPTTEGGLCPTARNPWNRDYNSGGSSGGAAAAVAAGIGPIGLGSDGAGSTRIPAACCGLVGLKGTTGAVPYQEARDAFGNVIAAGPLTRTIADCALMQASLGGYDPMDPWTANAPPIGKLVPALLSQDLSSIRIGYLSRSAAPKVSEDVLTGVQASLDVLAGLGAEVEEVKADIDWMSEHQRVLYLSSIATNLGSVVERFGDKTDRVLRAYVAAGKKYDIAAYIAAINARTRLFRAIQGLFETYDFLVSPTVTRTALSADFDGAASVVEVDGEPVGPTQPAFTGFVYPFNLTGHPALAVPSGWGNDGLPTSVQIIGPRHCDSSVLLLGGLLEQARPWAERKPALASH